MTGRRDADHPPPNRLAAFVASQPFQRTVLGAIVAGSILVGLETYPDLMARHGTLIKALDWFVIGLFAVEALLKMAQHGTRWYRYFLDPWNRFDFVILAACLLPVGGHFAAVLRLLRIFRAMRLVTALPRLQVLVGALFKSLPSMGYVGLLLLLLFYVYAVVGVALFQGNDPVHFGSLNLALLTLFRVVTLEDWTDVMYIQMYGSDNYLIANPTAIATNPEAQPILGALYFVSFVLVGTMVMLNLFIGVVLSSMDEAHREALRTQTRKDHSLSAEIEELGERLKTLAQQIQDVPTEAASKENGGSPTRKPPSEDQPA